MDARLHNAALKGDVPSLLSLLDEDALILDRATAVAETPLHVAALFGHSKFAEEILSRKPELVRKLDSEQSSPLHLASAKGHIEMVKVLLEYDTDMCLVRDQDGRTPFHVAAMKGRVEVVKVLIGKNGTAARVLSRQREPILHFCVNHGQFVIVRELLQSAENDEESDFINMKDDDDNTILHLAVAKKHVPLTEFLLQKKKMREEVNALNVDGFTALDVLLQNRSKSKYMKLEGILRGAGAKKAKVLHRKRDNWTIQPLSRGKDKWKKHIDWLNETRSILMVVAILISTVTFQAGMNPPGGVWDDSKIVSIRGTNKTVTAGQSIMAESYPLQYILFTIFNVIAFIASLSIILLLTSGFHIKQRIFMWALMIITWLSVSSMIVTYGIGYFTVSTADHLPQHSDVILISVLGWLLLNGLLFAAHFFRCVVSPDPTTSGFPLKRRNFMWALMITTWLSVSSMIVTYSIGYYTVSTGDALPDDYSISLVSVLGWLLLNGLLFAAHFVRFIMQLVRKVTTFTYACLYRNKPPSMDPTNVNVGYIDVESHIQLN